MDGMLSQEEINALLSSDGAEAAPAQTENVLTDEEKDAVGEIANICMAKIKTKQLKKTTNNKKLKTKK